MNRVGCLLNFGDAEVGQISLAGLNDRHLANAKTGYSRQASKQKKRPGRNVQVFLLCWRLPILPGRFQPSIVGTSELNCCVRDGNRCTLTVISTNSGAAAVKPSLFEAVCGSLRLADLQN